MRGPGTPRADRSAPSCRCPRVVHGRRDGGRLAGQLRSPGVEGLSEERTAGGGEHVPSPAQRSSDSGHEEASLVGAVERRNVHTRKTVPFSEGLEDDATSVGQELGMDEAILTTGGVRRHYGLRLPPGGRDRIDRTGAVAASRREDDGALLVPVTRAPVARARAPDPKRLARGVDYPQSPPALSRVGPTGV